MGPNGEETKAEEDDRTTRQIRIHSRRNTDEKTEMNYVGARRCSGCGPRNGRACIPVAQLSHGPLCGEWHSVWPIGLWIIFTLLNERDAGIGGETDRDDRMRNRL